MASAMHRMCLVGCQKQQWFNEIVRDGGRVKLEMTLQQCGIAFAGNCAPSALGVSTPPGASAFIRMVECICSIACEDRTRLVSGKGVSVSVGVVGRRSIKKTKHKP